MPNKLELTFVGKNDEVNIEPRILIENKELSNVESDNNTENMIIHGDNLLALKALESKYAGKVKCIYIDPPYNTGSAFEHYDDNLEHSIWLKLMKMRLEILRRLLKDEGTIFIQIDDEEQAYLKVLCDEVFGRKNFINMISVNMKNIAGASGGGEDKRLKKNCEYILIYSKDYEKFNSFKKINSYTEISKLLKYYEENDISWKYTSVIVNKGKKEYVCSTKDGTGEQIKIYRRADTEFKSVNKIAQEENLQIKEVYKKYFNSIFVTAMPQSSIRPRVLNALVSNGDILSKDSVYSIEYIPITGKNKGKVYEQFYKGEKLRLFAWFKDVAVIRDNNVYKIDEKGTYWDGYNLNNLTKEGGVEFKDGKKPEELIKDIVEMQTNENDIVLDSFLGSGTTCAVAHKMKRRYIGIEMGEHAYTHCKVRLDKVIAGTDKGGITDSVKWDKGGGYRFYELAPTLIKKDEFGIDIINEEYNAEMLAAAVALHEGYTYNPDKNVFWKQAYSNEHSYLYVTTNFVDENYIKNIHDNMGEEDYLIVVCKNYKKSLDSLYKNIKIKKIPESLLKKCEFSKDNYNLNIVSPPIYEEDL